MRSENCLRIFSAQGESTKQRETKGGDQSKAVTNILISLFSEITSVQHFQQELDVYQRDFVGGPTPLHRADRLTEFAGTIWLKREDLAHTGAHKINNAIGQALLAKRIGKRRQTGAGLHRVHGRGGLREAEIERVLHV